MSQVIDFDKMRFDIAVKFNQMTQVLNSHQEQMVCGDMRVEVDAREAQRLANELRHSVSRLLHLECEEIGITAATTIKLERMIVEPARAYA